MNKQGYSKQDNPLRLLIESADKKSIEALNLTKEDLGIVDKDGRSPIFWCCTFGQSTILEYFLQLGADINAADKGEWRTLHVACSKGDVELVSTLLQFDPDVSLYEANVQNKSMHSPLHYACSKGHLQVVTLLLSSAHHININIQNLQGETPLMRAVVAGQRDICSCLIQEGGKLDIRNEEGNTALHLAAIEEQDEIAILLLNNGANIRLCNKSDQKPVFYAKPKLQNTIISMINEGLIE